MEQHVDSTATDDPQDPIFEHGGHPTALEFSIATVHVDASESVTTRIDGSRTLTDPAWP